MNVILAESAGFCFGVKRAVEMVYEQAGSGRPVYTYGPIIHNEEVVRDLEERGVRVAERIEEFADLPKGTVVIRAHGVERGVSEALERLGFSVVDATCPFVKKIHRLVESKSREGNQIVIVGDGTHPEVRGIRSWSVAEATYVISDAEDARDFAADPARKVCVVAQTTFNYNKFQELVEIIRKKGYDIIVLNTICNATEERQAEAAQIAGQVDAMIVIGGRNSSNTQKLFEICHNKCNNTYYIQTIKDLKLADFRYVDNVGITAGASTPNNIIEEVQKNVRNEF